MKISASGCDFCWNTCLIGFEFDYFPVAPVPGRQTRLYELTVHFLFFSAWIEVER